MKFTFLGTAAAEGFPALFCNCQYCIEARKLGGKNIRTRSQSIINDDLLLDFPAETYTHFLQNGIEGDKIQYVLITHSHSDHFYPKDLFIRCGAFAHNMRVPTLKVFCPSTVYNTFTNFPNNVEITRLNPYETVEIGPYRVTPMPAKHHFDAEAFIYIVQGDKTVLYAHDTGYFYEEVFSFIEKNKFVFDMVTLDCCNMNLPITDEDGHMGYPNIERVLARLASYGAVTENTIKFVNHFSHNGNPLHHILEEDAKKYGYQVSYDGCQVDI